MYEWIKTGLVMVTSSMVFYIRTISALWPLQEYERKCVTATMFAMLALCVCEGVRGGLGDGGIMCMYPLGSLESLKKGVREPSSGFLSLMKNSTDNRRNPQIHTNTINTKWSTYAHKYTHWLFVLGSLLPAVFCYKPFFPPSSSGRIKCDDPINTDRDKHTKTNM